MDYDCGDKMTYSQKCFGTENYKLKISRHHDIPSERQTRQGFTLIELLVVIAIIALLLSIILPSLRLAKEHGKRVVCASNARQLTLGWTMYAQQNKNKLVGAVPGYADGWWIADIENSLLWPYVQNLDNYTCPAGIPGYAITYSISDGMNANGGAPCTARLTNRKITDIIMPAERMVFIDEGRSMLGGYTQYNIPVYWWDPVPCRHGNSTSVSLADGHVELWKWRDQRSPKWNYDEWVKWATGSGSSVRLQPNNEDMIKMQKAMWRILE
jgi:prepilin-type N-terminal cleavage/methylation domain-containing protein/prepilin-type processing-associated H-X9-DG protein